MGSKYNTDDTLREVIRLFMENKLMAAGLVDSVQLVDFTLGKDFEQTDDDIVQIKQIDGTFKTIEDTFTIGMITDFLGTPEPIKGLKLITYTLPMVFLVSTKSKYDDIKQSLERFVISLIGEEFTESGYFFGTNCSEITNTEQVQDINGIEYVKMTCTAFVTTSVEALIGNFIETYFGEAVETKLRVYPTERSGSRAFITEETHKNNEKESTTLNKESTWVGNLSVIVNTKKDLYVALIQHLEAPTSLNKEWYYSTTYGKDKDDADIGPYIKTVVITGITLDGEIGTYALISLVLKKSGLSG